MKSSFFLFVSLAADLSITVAKFVAASFTGSAAMTAEAIHSVIDAGSQLLLIWGVKSSKREPDASRPYGYGRELYYWSLLVSLVIFILGGCISVYEGISRLNHPALDGDPTWNYVILGFAFVFNFISMVSALKAFNAQRQGDSFINSLIETNDPSTIIVLLGDFGDLLGLIVAFLGILLSRLHHNSAFDGYASILIGLILIVISGFLIRESKSLLIGESISRKVVKEILVIVKSDQSVITVKKYYSIYRSPEDATMQLETVFKSHLKTKEITAAIRRIAAAIKKRFPNVTQVVIEPIDL